MLFGVPSLLLIMIDISVLLVEISGNKARRMISIRHGCFYKGVIYIVLQIMAASSSLALQIMYSTHPCGIKL